MRRGHKSVGSPGSTSCLTALPSGGCSRLCGGSSTAAPPRCRQTASSSDLGELERVTAPLGSGTGAGATPQTDECGARGPKIHAQLDLPRRPRSRRCRRGGEKGRGRASPQLADGGGQRGTSNRARGLCSVDPARDKRGEEKRAGRRSRRGGARVAEDPAG
jgi:hypothetical protein